MITNPHSRWWPLISACLACLLFFWASWVKEHSRIVVNGFIGILASVGGSIIWIWRSWLITGGSLGDETRWNSGASKFAIDEIHEHHELDEIDETANKDDLFVLRMSRGPVVAMSALWECLLRLECAPFSCYVRADLAWFRLATCTTNENVLVTDQAARAGALKRKTHVPFLASFSVDSILELVFFVTPWWVWELPLLGALELCKQMPCCKRPSELSRCHSGACFVRILNNDRQRSSTTGAWKMGIQQGPGCYIRSLWNSWCSINGTRDHGQTRPFCNQVKCIGGMARLRWPFLSTPP